jgi:hypothetical protein
LHEQLGTLFETTQELAGDINDTQGLCEDIHREMTMRIHERIPTFADDPSFLLRYDNNEDYDDNVM